MHLPDGDRYPSTYAPVPRDVQAIAVGWLDASHPYNVGSVDDEFVAQLFEACRMHASARTRGWHRCPLCSTNASGLAPRTTVSREGESLPLGDAEVRVVAEDGTWLIAPTLVLHYVRDHSYQPPAAFVEAVTAGRFAPS